MFSHLRYCFFVFPLLLFAVLLQALTTASSNAQSAMTEDSQVTVTNVEFLGFVTFPTGFLFADTEVGGLSGITYDAKRGVYYALSDDRSSARYYTVDIDVSDGTLDPGDVTFLDVTFLQQQAGGDFPPGSLDPEGIELPRSDYIYISSEGDADATPPIDPFVNRFNPVGKQNRELPIPDKFLPGVDADGNKKGVRDNLAFKSLTSTPNRKYLYTATENALEQDGPTATLTETSRSRLLEYSLFEKRPGAEYVYIVQPAPLHPDPPSGFADNGLVELQALDNHGTFLAMERAFVEGVGNWVVLFETTTQGATDVSDIFSLSSSSYWSYWPMVKREVADLEIDLGVVPDNLEGMTFGPPLPDGRMLLILVSDNNFDPAQVTQFIALAVALEPK